VSEANLEIVRRAWDAWADRDLDRLTEDWDPDIEWDLSNFEEAPPGMRARGVAQVMALIANWMAAFEIYELTVDEQAAAGEKVLLIVSRRARERATGKQVDTTAAQVWTLRDGRIVQIASYSDLDAGRKAAGLDG
jgi:ketosteroid isomerase-like protein